MESLLKDYETATTDAHYELNANIVKHHYAVQRRAAEMSAKKHAKLLRNIILGHVGGTMISVEYTVPLLETTKETLISEFRRCGWRVEAKETESSLTIANFPIHDLADLRSVKGTFYEEFTYRRHKKRVHQTAGAQYFYCNIDFVNSDRRTDRINDLVLFSRNILVSVYDLQVPLSHMCSYGAAEMLRIAYNEGYEISLERE